MRASRQTELEKDFLIHVVCSWLGILRKDRHAGAGPNPDRTHVGHRWRGEPNLPARHDVRLRHRRRSGVQGQRRPSQREADLHPAQERQLLPTDSQERRSRSLDVKNERHLEYWIRQPVDVYLVIRQQDEMSGEGTIRWMNVTRYLKNRKYKQSRQIVFDGQKLDMNEVWKVRDEFFPPANTRK